MNRTPDATLSVSAGTISVPGTGNNSEKKYSCDGSWVETGLSFANWFIGTLVGTLVFVVVVIYLPMTWPILLVNLFISDDEINRMFDDVDDED